MTERELLIDCLRRLNASAVAYMLTGSMASNYWGIPRTTHDIDIVVQIDRSQVRDVVAAFQGDFYLDELSVDAAFAPPHQFNAIDTRSALKIDFWMLSRRPFELCMFERRMAVVLFGEPAFVATAEDVILHKLYWDSISPSDRQMGDAAGVVAVQGDTLDRRYLQAWAVQLGVGSRLQDLLDGTIRPKKT